MLSSGLKCYMFVYAWMTSWKGLPECGNTDVPWEGRVPVWERKIDDMIPTGHLCFGTWALWAYTYCSCKDKWSSSSHTKRWMKKRERSVCKYVGKLNVLLFPFIFLPSLLSFSFFPSFFFFLDKISLYPRLLWNSILMSRSPSTSAF